MPATRARTTDGSLRVHVSGTGDEARDMRDALSYADGITLIDQSARLNGSVDAVLHIAGDPARLAEELASIRSMTAAPIIVGAAGGAENLLADALEHGAADMVLLPQSAESIVFAIRKLTRAHAATSGRTATIVTVFSPKGGTGKTVTSTNLARKFARRGLRTLLVDLDVQFGDAAIMLGAVPSETLHDLVTSPGQLDAEKLAGYATVVDEYLSLVAAPARPEEGEHVTEEAVKSVLGIARRAYDVVIVDTAPSFDAPMLAAMELTDELLVICGPEVPAVKNVRLALETLDLLAFSKDKVSILFNRDGMKGAVSAAEVEHALERPIDFVVPDDISVPTSVNRGRSAVDCDPRSAFSRAIGEMASRLVPAQAEPVESAKRFSLFANRS